VWRVGSPASMPTAAGWTMIDAIQPKPNPFLELGHDGRPLYQLKLSLVLYLGYAPGPKRALKVYREYMRRFGSRIRFWQCTSPVGPPQAWDSRAQRRFETELLPRLHTADDWGYGFSDGRDVDYHLFMFH